MHLRIGFDARRLEAGLDHPQAAERKDRPLERFVGLQSDDHLVVAVDVARRVRRQRRGCGDIDVEHALLRLFAEERLELFPDRERPLGGLGEKFGPVDIRRHVGYDEFADVDLALPFRP